MVRYRIKKKRKAELRRDVFIDTTETWIVVLRNWAVPIVVGALAVLAVVVAVIWSQGVQRDRAGYLWDRLHALRQENAFTDEIVERWKALLADSAGTDVEPFVMLGYSGKLVGQVKTDLLAEARTYVDRVRTGYPDEPELQALAEQALQDLDRVLSFQPPAPEPGAAPPATEGAQETGAAEGGPEDEQAVVPEAPKKKSSFRTEASVGAGGAAVPAGPGDAGSEGKAPENTDPDNAAPDNSAQEGGENASPVPDGAPTPVGGAPVDGATSPVVKPKPVAPRTPEQTRSAEDGDATEAAKEEADQVRQRRRPPP